MKIKKEVRKRVYERDGYKCIECGTTENLTIDHITPIIEGGLNIEKNMQTMCYSCNSYKSNRYKLPLFKHLKKIWYIHDYVQNWKNEVKSLAYETGKTNTKKLEDEINIKLSAVQSSNDKRINDLIAIIKNQNNKLDEQGEVIRLLTEYLKIKYVSSQTIEAHFEKRK